MEKFVISLDNSEDELLSQLSHYPELIMDCKFNEYYNSLYTCHVDGGIYKIIIDFHEKKMQSITKIFEKKGSCRNIEFIDDRIISIYNTGEILVLDQIGKVIWKTPKSGTGMNALLCINNDIIVTGDDEGFVEIWDLREKSNKPFSKFRDYEDCINDLCFNKSKNSLLVVCGDTLGVYDTKSIINRKNKDHLIALSDPQEENILCTKVIRNNSKVVCGTDEGNLLFFSWGNFGDCSDRMLIPFIDGFEKDNSIEHIEIYQDQFAIISTSDGILKVVEFFPNQVIGTLSIDSVNQLKNFNIECSKITISNKNNFIVCSHGTQLDFYNLNIVDEIISNSSSSSISNNKKKRKKSSIHNDFFQDL